MTEIRYTPRLQRIATLAIAAIAYFVAALLALHVLRPDLNPISEETSKYALGPYGLLMSSAFLSMSLAVGMLVFGLYQGLAPQARSRIGLGLLGLFGVGVLVAMLFPIDLEGAPQTFAGTIHRINGTLTFLSLSIGAVLVSWRLKHAENWRPISRAAQMLSLLVLAEFVVTGASIATQSGFAGLSQRIFIATFVAWLLLIATRLRTVVGESPALAYRDVRYSNMGRSRESGRSH